MSRSVLIIVLPTLFALCIELAFADDYNKVFGDQHKTSDCPIRAMFEPQKVERSSTSTSKIPTDLEPNQRWIYTFKRAPIRRIQVKFKAAPLGANLFFRWTGYSKDFPPETFGMSLGS